MNFKNALIFAFTASIFSSMSMALPDEPPASSASSLSSSYSSEVAECRLCRRGASSTLESSFAHLNSICPRCLQIATLSAALFASQQIDPKQGSSELNGLVLGANIAALTVFQSLVARGSTPTLDAQQRLIARATSLLESRRSSYYQLEQATQLLIKNAVTAEVFTLGQLHYIHACLKSRLAVEESKWFAVVRSNPQPILDAMNNVSNQMQKAKAAIESAGNIVASSAIDLWDENSLSLEASYILLYQLKIKLTDAARTQSVTLLQDAILRNHLACARMLLEMGVDVNAKDPEGSGRTALELVKSDEMASLLLGYGAEILSEAEPLRYENNRTWANMPSFMKAIVKQRSKNPIMLAIADGDIERVQQLLATEPELANMPRPTGYFNDFQLTPLLFAVITDQPNVVRVLLGYGALVYDASFDGHERNSMTPLLNNSCKEIFDGFSGTNADQRALYNEAIRKRNEQRASEESASAAAAYPIDL